MTARVMMPPWPGPVVVLEIEAPSMRVSEARTDLNGPRGPYRAVPLP